MIKTTTALLATLSLCTCQPQFMDPIKVGILHSQSGTMASSEIPVAEATLMAIDEINANGGLLGRQIETVYFDGESNEKKFAEMAEKLDEITILAVQGLMKKV